MHRLIRDSIAHPRLVGAALAALIAGTLVFAGHVTVGLGGHGQRDLLDHWLYDGLLVAAGACCVWRALSVSSNRGSWAAIGLACWCWVLGDLYWNMRLADLAEPPYPTWADAGY